MEINAVAHFQYWDGEAITSGWERLVIVVKFKEKGKLFKTKLNKTLASTYNFINSGMVPEEDRYSSYDEYYDNVEYIIGDKELIHRVVENMVINHFKKKHEDDSKNSRSKNIEKRISKMDKIEVKVKVK